MNIKWFQFILLLYSMSMNNIYPHWNWHHWFIFAFIFELDPQHPLAPVSIPILQGNQHQDIVIPCKPTSRKYDVKLIKEGDEVNLTSLRFEIQIIRKFSFFSSKNLSVNYYEINLIWREEIKSGGLPIGLILCQYFRIK